MYFFDNQFLFDLFISVVSWRLLPSQPLRLQPVDF